MAEYILDVMSQTSKLDWAFPFQRTGAFPIDRSAIFSSLNDAQNYAMGVNEGEEAKDERKLGGTSYVGQIISVYEPATEEGGAATVNAYIITPARGLMKLASTTASGDISSDVANLQGEVKNITDQITSLNTAIEGKASQADIEEAVKDKADASAVTALEEVVEAKAEKSYVDEELAKKANADDLTAKADKSYVDEELAKKANAADVYTKDEVYTKSEVETYVNGQIGSAGHLKREIVEALPLESTADVDTIYMIKKSGGLVDQDHYEEYMVINGAWELIGDTYVDLSNYATTEYVDQEIEAVEGAIALKADQSALDTANEEIAKKADSETVNSALEAKADKTQVATDIANAIAPLAVKTEIEEALAAKANAEDVYSKSDVYNKTEIDGALELKADKSYVDDELATKADEATTLEGYGITDAYTKEQVDAELLKKANQQDHNTLVDTVNGKADKATTLAGYGITDAYTSKQVDDLISQLSGDNSESAASVLAQLNTYKNENDARVANAEGRIKALEDAGADDNVIENIKIAGEDAALEVVDKTVTLPAATEEKLGLAKLSSEVGVDANGALEVKSLNANKLTQSTGEFLILYGGSASDNLPPVAES